MLTSTQAAAAIGCSPRTARRLAGQHGIGQKTGRDWMFTKADAAELRRIHRANVNPPAEEMSRRARMRRK